jgi:phosphatidyl-myo-inositol dimannoside synthase
VVGRVLYLVPDLAGPTGGIARYSRLVCRALAEENVEVDVHALRDRPAPTAAREIPAGKYSGYGGNRPAFASGVLRAAAKPYDLVISGHINFAPLSLVAARVRARPLVSLAYGIEVWSRLPWHRRWALQHSQRVVAISRFTARHAAETNNLSHRRLRVVYNCLDPSLTLHQSSAPAGDGLSLLTVARLSRAEKYKGHDQVIRALPSLLSSHLKLVYDIVGDGDDRARLELLAANLGVAHAVRFHGTIAEDQLAQRYAHADIFVMPSRGEGFGFVFLEAMAFSKPVVAGNQDAAQEVVENGVTGLLVDPLDVSGLVEALRLLLDDASMRREMGRRGADVLQERFTYDVFRRQVASCLGDLMSPATESVLDLPSTPLGRP